MILKGPVAVIMQQTLFVFSWEITPPSCARRSARRRRPPWCR